MSQWPCNCNMNADSDVSTQLYYIDFCFSVRWSVPVTLSNRNRHERNVCFLNRLDGKRTLSQSILFHQLLMFSRAIIAFIVNE